MNPNEDVLDDYLKENQRSPSGRKDKATRSVRDSPITQFRRWQACAAMQIVAVIGILVGMLTLSLILFTTSTTWAIYGLITCAAFLFIALIYLAIDYVGFLRWTTGLRFSLEGHLNVLNACSRKFWSHSGEYWIATQVSILFHDKAPEKHRQVVQVFLKRLRKRLDQWTVSEDKQIGYSQPDGWRYLDYTLAGDMNARVFNLLRKRLSGEFNGLVKHMPGSIARVIISTHGGEKHHAVNHDID